MRRSQRRCSPGLLSAFIITFKHEQQVTAIILALTKAMERVSSSALIFSRQQRERFLWQTLCNSCTILSSRWLAFRGAAVSPAPNDFEMRATGHSFPSPARLFPDRTRSPWRTSRWFLLNTRQKRQALAPHRRMEAGSGFAISEGFSRVSVKGPRLKSQRNEGTGVQLHKF